MKFTKSTRRRFLLSLALGTPAAVAADARWLEPEWLRVTRVHLSQRQPTHRVVHFTDLHHKGDRAYLGRVVDEINRLAPDFTCFTGDLMEVGAHLPEALEFLRRIKSPLYGVPGNHDYWAKIDFGPVKECFAATGGAWLLDEAIKTRDGAVTIHGATCKETSVFASLTPDPSTKNIFLFHYPAWVKSTHAHFDLMLSGHSHGGQVRLPFLGPLVVPYGVDQYDLGLFQTNAGPLYVGAGIGYFYLNLRFRCRPEITLFEV